MCARTGIALRRSVACRGQCGNRAMGDAVHILVVDDDDAIRETLRFALEDAGYQVSEAAEGMAALRLLRATRDRMWVLLDLMMPGLDGAGELGARSGGHPSGQPETYNPFA